MPSIAIGLPECGFLEDLPDVTFTGVTATAYATVKLDDVTLLSNIRLTPDKQNRIVIYARQMIRSLVSLTKPAAFETLLPMLQVQLRVGSTVFRRAAPSFREEPVKPRPSMNYGIRKISSPGNHKSSKRPDSSLNGSHIHQPRFTHKIKSQVGYIPETDAYSTKRSAPTPEARRCIFDRFKPTSRTYGEPSVRTRNSLPSHTTYTATIPKPRHFTLKGISYAPNVTTTYVSASKIH